MRRISWIIIAISLLTSCVTPREYVYVYPDPIELPGIDSVISKDLRDRIEEPLNLVMEPETVGDLLNNMHEYQQGYLLFREYSEALEEFIDEIIAIHNKGGAIKDGTKNGI